MHLRGLPSAGSSRSQAFNLSDQHLYVYAQMTCAMCWHISDPVRKKGLVRKSWQRANLGPQMSSRQADLTPPDQLFIGAILSKVLSKP